MLKDGFKIQTIFKNSLTFASIQVVTFAESTASIAVVVPVANQSVRVRSTGSSNRSVHVFTTYVVEHLLA